MLSHTGQRAVPKLNLSFSPGFSLGFSVRSKLRNRFNGFPISSNPGFGKTVETVFSVRVDQQPQAEAWGE